MAFGQFNQSMTGERKASGTYERGVLVQALPAPLSITASVQPASENELHLLPEGRREGGAYTLRSKAEIMTGDVFTIGGDRHEVIKTQTWQNGVIPHYLGVAVREEVAP